MVLQIYSKAPRSSICNPIIKLKENIFVLPLTKEKFPLVSPFGVVTETHEQDTLLDYFELYGILM